MQTALWKNFQVEWTEDSSPTLRLNGAHPTDQTKSAESMHHSGGAATETLYIYGEAISWVLKTFPEKQLHICSVGLGLGYNEILTAILLMDNSAKTAKLDSFEIDTELKESFSHWVFESDLQNSNQTAKNIIYDQIVEKLTKSLYLNIKLSEIKKYLQMQFHSGSWRLNGELNLDKIPEFTNYHLCLFDAFSQKTTHELWNDHFLNRFIQKSFNKTHSMLATYACTGVLTRALKNNGFSVIKKPGFQGKRDSTWAERNKA